jgi:hypothetical protein
MVNRHWTIRDVDILNPNNRLSGVFDAITCISVIEHIENHSQAMRNMVRLLAPGGLLVLTTPYSHRQGHPNVYRHSDALYGQDAPYICRSSSKEELEQWLETGLTLVRRELWQLFSGPLWATGQRCDWRQACDEGSPHQLGCFAFVKTSEFKTN